MKEKSKSLFWCLALLLFMSCAGRKPKPSTVLLPGPPQPTGPGKQEPAPEPPPIPKVHSPKIALVFGGAGIASFAAVGILKKFEQEGVPIRLVVTTGWPTLFCLGYGFLKSMHDLEWFAMRLQEKDFYQVSIFDLNKGFASHEKLTSLVQNTFQQRDLSTTKVPVVISASNTDLGEAEVYDRGDWKEPLLKTMSVPGIYRPYFQNNDTEWVQSLQGMDVEEAIRRGGADIIIAVEMYEDYLASIKNSKQKSSDAVFRKLYLTELRKGLRKQESQAHIVGKIVLNKAPNDFSIKRLAIQAGIREATRLLKEIGYR